MYYEDCSEGDDLEPATIRPRAEDMKLIAAILDDPYPAHFDEEWVSEQGYPGLLNQGPANLSYLFQRVFDVLESPADLRSFDSRYDRMVFEGEAVTATATVRERRVVDGEGRVEFGVELRTDEGETAVAGTVTARLPRREDGGEDSEGETGDQA